MTFILKSLHWLKTSVRIHFKVLSPSKTVTPSLQTGLSSQNLHHPANPLYSTILMAQSFSTLGHYQSPTELYGQSSPTVITLCIWLFYESPLSITHRHDICIWLFYESPLSITHRHNICIWRFYESPLKT